MENSAAPDELCHSLLQKPEDYARAKPTKAVLCAFGLGFFLNMLPLGAIAAALTAVVLSMTRPVLLFFGVMKVCEMCRAKYETQN